MGEKGDRYMRDGLGEYGEFEVPQGFELPLLLNDDHDAVGLNSGNLFAFWGMISEEVPRLKARRLCEFMVRLANGELKLDKGRVYKKVGEQYQKGRLVVTYDLAEELAQVK